MERTANPLLKVGHLVLGTVCKAQPDALSYLVWIQPAGPFGLLPKHEADREYKIGDVLFAAIKEVLVPYPRLSQQTLHYIRRIAELVLSPIREQHRLTVSRVAYRTGWPWAKVLVRVASPEALKEACSLLPQAKQHSQVKFILIPKVEDLEEQVRLALFPAPPHAITRIVSDDQPRSLVLEVDFLSRGRVIGPGGLNLRAAELLVRRRLRLSNTQVHGSVRLNNHHHIMEDTDGHLDRISDAVSATVGAE